MGADAKAWEQCPHCKELFGGVYDKRVKLSDIVASASGCTRCWAVCQILQRVTDANNVSTTLVGSIWHDNTLEIGVIGPEDTFETAPGYKIYLVPHHVEEKRARSDPTLGIPIATDLAHENYRPIRGPPEERLALAKSWLSECVASHDTCNADVEEYNLPRRLLDISDDNLIRLIHTEHHLPPVSAYIALSYCWGQDGGNLCTYRSNLDQHMAGIPIPSLPPTIRDVIFACKQLGQPYLWVDALCILQDDLDDKMTQIPQMADIYSGSLLTISAAGSSSVLEGCPLASVELQPVQPHVFELEYPLETGGSSSDKPGRRVTAVIERMEHERCRILPGHWARETFDQDPRDLLNAIEERAWTYQERFLAKRTLFIGKGEMSWICASEVQCECRKNGPQIKTEEGDRVFTHRYNISQVSVKKLFGNLEMDKTYSFLWTDIVAAYSARSLTQFSDRVAALEGISVAFRRRWPDIFKDDEYVFGCWKPFLAHLLIWETSGQPVSARIDQDFFPSWAWPSCGRPVRFTSWVWYGVNPKSWVQVLDLEVKQADGRGGFGHGKGTLTLRAPLIPVRQEVVRYDDDTEGILLTPIDTDLPFLTGGPTSDDPSKALDADKTVTHVVLLASYPFKPLKKSRPLSCALLCVAPVIGRDGEFRRVGMMTTPRAKTGFWGFHFQRLVSAHVTDFKLV
ncbi:heterokaryon incompatibility protein-domain-containing protein [Lasiosphaeris hirsuta]|uniref:Heterokaryon incompatibility protein-domain-containing protein n=1 Tax=Lasiosphaeris hirsuta TaxID=260670 RepID=A0AA40AHS2_9PEZI|nr:heterokaryon incompatibility protein-domain-containing protein [Lasiosphaeris hirsuta]